MVNKAHSKFKPHPIVITRNMNNEGEKQQFIIYVRNMKPEPQTTAQIIQSIEDACCAFAATEEGKQLAKDNGQMLTWENVIEDIPNDALRLYGIYRVNSVEVMCEVNYDEPLFFNYDTCI